MYPTGSLPNPTSVTGKVGDAKMAGLANFNTLEAKNSVTDKTDTNGEYSLTNLTGSEKILYYLFTVTKGTATNNIQLTVESNNPEETIDIYLDDTDVRGNILPESEWYFFKQIFIIPGLQKNRQLLQLPVFFTFFQKKFFSW